MCVKDTNIGDSHLKPTFHETNRNDDDDKKII